MEMDDSKTTGRAGWLWRDGYPSSTALGATRSLCTQDCSTGLDKTTQRDMQGIVVQPVEQ